MAGESEVKISGINFQPVIFRNYTAAQAPETTTTSAPEKATDKNNNGQEKSRDSVSISPEASVLNKFQLEKAGTVTEPAAVKADPQKVISQKLTEMKTTLEGITKNYPPFPVESRERAAILETYNALRKEIEKMTFPPSLDMNNNRKGWMWDDLFKKDVLANLPAPMEPTASDKTVHDAVDTMTQLQDVVRAQGA